MVVVALTYVLIGFLHGSLDDFQIGDPYIRTVFGYPVLAGFVAEVLAHHRFQHHPTRSARRALLNWGAAALSAAAVAGLLFLTPLLDGMRIQAVYGLALALIGLGTLAIGGWAQRRFFGPGSSVRGSLLLANGLAIVLSGLLGTLLGLGVHWLQERFVMFS